MFSEISEEVTKGVTLTDSMLPRLLLASLVGAEHCIASSYGLSLDKMKSGSKELGGEGGGGAGGESSLVQR